VRDGGRPVSSVNELQYVRGEIYANIWQQDLIARIDPDTGRVLGWLDLSPLRKELPPGAHVDVINGIAFDSEKNRLFVTGKLWPKLFQIEMPPAGRTK